MAWVKGAESRPDFCGGGLHRITWHTEKLGTCSGHECVWIFDGSRTNGSLRASWDKVAWELMGLWLEAKNPPIAEPEVEEPEQEPEQKPVAEKREALYIAEFKGLVEDLIDIEEREYSYEESSEIVLELRQRHGISQRDFAKVFGTGRSMVSSIEIGSRKLTVSYLRALKGKARATYKL